MITTAYEILPKSEYPGPLSYTIKFFHGESERKFRFDGLGLWMLYFEKVYLT